MIVCCTRRPWRYSPLLTRELVFIAFAIHLPPQTLMDNYLHLLFLHSSPVGLVITRYPETLVVVLIILWAYRLAVLCHLNTPMDNSRTYRVSAHPPVVHVFHNGLRNTIRSSKNPLVAYCSAILVYLHDGCYPYVWQYSLVSLGIVILILLIQHECKCMQSSVDPFKLSFRLRRHFKHELVLKQSNCRRLYS